MPQVLLWTDALGHVTRLKPLTFCLSQVARSLTSGHLITFEGVEGCGKTTQVELLAEELKRRGFSVIATREPGGTDLGCRLRQLLLGSCERLPPLAELLIYLADRICHLEQVIVPALDAGKIVLCDRFSDSTIAYQGFGRGCELELVRDWERRTREEIVPYMTFLLDCPVEVGLQRVRKRGRQDRFEREKTEFHQRVRDGFLRLAADDPGRIRVVDSTLPVAQTHGTIISSVLERLGKG